MKYSEVHEAASKMPALSNEQSVRTACAKPNGYTSCENVRWNSIISAAVKPTSILDALLQA